MDGPTAGGQSGGTRVGTIGFPHDGAAGFKKNECKPHLRKYWKIPPEGSAAFVAAMEDVLEVYHLPYDSSYPVVCMDESCKQLIGEVRRPMACMPGQPERIDDEVVIDQDPKLFFEVHLQRPVASRCQLGCSFHSITVFCMRLSKLADFGNRSGTGFRVMYNLLIFLAIQKRDAYQLLFVKCKISDFNNNF
jgi:hypothetical protein